MGARLVDYPITLAKAIEYAQNRGALVVAAAGNNGADNEDFYPAVLPGVLAVGATDREHRNASFSNSFWGSVRFVRAPGVDILSTVPQNVGKKYDYMSGTSQAAAFVSGVAAMYRYALPHLDAQDIAACIEDYTHMWQLSGYTYTTYNYILDAYYAFTKLAQGWGSDIYDMQFLTPEDDERISGTVDLSVYLSDTSSVYKVEFVLYDSQNQLYILDTVTRGQEGGIPASGIVTVPFDTTQPLSYFDVEEGIVKERILPDGAYSIGAIAYDIDEYQLWSSWIYVFIANQASEGLSIEVRKPDGTPGAKSKVAVIHMNEDPEGIIYETVWQGSADMNGNVYISPTYANAGNDYLVIAYGNEPSFFYYKIVRSPGKHVLDSTGCVEVTFTATKIDGDPLSDAVLYMEMLQGTFYPGIDPELPIVYDTDLYDARPMMIPIETFKGNGKTVLTVSKGLYNFYTLQLMDRYFLARQNVIINQTVETIDFTMEGAAILQFEPDEDAYKGSLSFYLDDYAFYGIGFDNIKAHEQVVLKPGSYYMNFAITYRVPSETGSSGTEWTYTYYPTLELTEGVNVIRTGKPLTSQLQLYYDREHYQNEVVFFEYIVSDPYGNVISEITYEPYTSTAGISSAEESHIILTDPLYKDAGRKTANSRVNTYLYDGEGNFVLKTAAKSYHSSTLTVTDQDGEVIREMSSWRFFFSWITSENPSNSYYAAPGVYTAVASLDPGPMGDSVIYSEPVYVTILDANEQPPFEIEDPDVAITIKGLSDMDEGENIIIHRKDESGKYAIFEHYEIDFIIEGEEGIVALYYLPEGEYLVSASVSSRLYFTEFEYTGERMALEIDGTSLEMTRVTLFPKDHEGNPFGWYFDEENTVKNPNTLPMTLDVNMVTVAGDVVIGRQFLSVDDMEWENASFTFYVPKNREYIFVISADSDVWWNSGPFLYQMTLKKVVNEPLVTDVGGTDLVPLVITTAEPILDRWSSSNYITKAALFLEDLTYAPRLSPDYFDEFTEDEYFLAPGIIYATPGVYRAIAVLSFESYDSFWYYWLENTLELKKDTENPDAVTEWKVGQDFTLSFELDQSDYGVGDKVVSTQKVSDEFGNRVVAAVSGSFEKYYEDVYGYGSQQAQSMDDELLEALDHYIIAPFFTIKDNVGNQKARFKTYNRRYTMDNILNWNAVLIRPSSYYDDEEVILVRPFLDSSYYSSEWVIPEDITGGAYTASLEVGLRPDNILTETLPFMINARAGAPLITLPVTRTKESSIQITGLTVPGATVKIFVGYNGNPATLAGSVDADPTGAFSMDIPLPDEGVYGIYGYATVGGTDGFESDPVVLIVDRTPPGMPKDLAAEALDATHLKLTWSAPDNVQDDPVSHYIVKRDGVVIADNLTFLPGQLLTYTDNTADQQNVYLYEVYAVDLAGNISNAAQINAGTGGAVDTVPPSIPTDVTVSYNNRKITVKWSPSTDNAAVAGYKVYRKAQGEEEAVVVKVLEITDEVPNIPQNLIFVDSDVSIETFYQYFVSAYDPTGNESAKSLPAEITTPSIGVSSVSVNIPSLFNKGPAVPGSEIEVRLLGDTGYIGEFELKVKSLIDQGGNPVEEPVEIILSGTMVDSDSTGLYKGNITLPEGVTDIVSVKAILKDLLEHIAFKETAVNKAVAGIIRVSVEAMSGAETSLLSGMTLSAYSYNVNYGSSVPLDEFKTYTMYVPQDGSYLVRIKDVNALDMAVMYDVSAEKGQITEISLRPQMPSTLNIVLVEEDGVTPIEGIEVKVRGPKNIVTGVTDETGTVVIPSTNGKPVLTDITGNASVSIITDEFFINYYSVDQTTTMQPGQNELKLICHRKPIATVTGTITNSLGDVVAGAQVTYNYIVNGKYIPVSVLTDENGRYTIQIKVDRDNENAYFRASHHIYSDYTKNIYVSYVAENTLNFVLQSKARIDFSVIVDGEEALDLVYETGRYYELTVKNITRGTLWKSMLRGHYMELNGVYPGDVLEITLDGRRINLTSHTVTVVSDENNTAFVEFFLSELGRIRARIRHEDGKPLIQNTWLASFYNEAGKLVLSQSETLKSDGVFTFNHLPDGIYKGVFELIKPKETYNIVELDEDTKIVVEDITVEHGKVTDIGDIILREAVYPINETGWFVGEGNSFTTSVNTIVPGGTAQLRVEFNCPDFGYSQIDNVTLIAEIPDQMSFVPDSVLLEATDGYSNPITDYILDYVTDGSGKVTAVKVSFGTIGDGLTGRMLYMVVADPLPDWPISRAEARMSYDTSENYGGLYPPQRSNLLGTVEINVSFVTITAPKMTETEDMTVSGRAIPNAHVKIMDEGQLVGEAVASKFGYWEASIRLADKGKPSIHYLTAVIEVDGALVASNRIRVDLVKEAVKLKKVTMRVNLGQLIEINPAFGVFKSNISWRPYGNDIDFTFDFTDNTAVYDVILKSGEGSKFPATYKDGIWVVKANYGGAIPGVFRISYKVVPKMWQTPDPNLTEEEIRATLPGLWRDADVTVDVTPIEEQGIRAQSTPPPQAASAVITLDSDGKIKMNMNMSVESATYMMTDEDMKLAAKGVPPVYGFVSNVDIIGNKMVFSMQGYIPDTYMDGQSVDELHSAAYQTPAKLVKVFGETALDGGMALQELFGTIKNAFDYNDDLRKLESLMDKAMNNCNSIAASYYNDLLYIQAKSLLGNLCIKYSLTLVGIGLSATGIGTLGGIAVSLATAAFGEYMDYKWDQEVDQIRDMIANDDACNDDDDTDDDSDIDIDENDIDIVDPKYFLDPSGYVYEAIPEIRIEGVTTTIFEYDPDTGSWHMWDASEGDQMNPLITDEEGRYAWDVPIGRWKVLYEKAGYMTVESHEMDVPPPHLDVNIGMVSTANPTVTSISAIGGGEGIRVTFDKYMRVDTVTDKTILVHTTDTDEFGDVTYIDGIVESLFEDTHDNLAVPGGKLSRTFKFIPTSGSLTVGGTYTVIVDKVVQDYGDIMMLDNVRQTVTVPERISPQSVTLDRNRLSLILTDKVRLIATVLPANADNKSVIWTSSDNSVATVDALGNVTAVGIGSARITATTAEGDLTAYCDVTVNTPVTGITLNKTQLTLKQGESESLTATVLPLYASDKSVTFTTSNSSVATVSADGKVYAVGVGTATITVTTNIGGKTASCTVTVEAAPVAPPVNYGSGTVIPISQFVMTIKPGAQTVTLFGGALILEIPEGAFDQEVKLTVRMTPNAYARSLYNGMEGSSFIGNVYEIDFGGVTAKKFIKMIESVDLKALGNSIPEKAGFFNESQSGVWNYVGSSMNTANGRVWGFIKTGGTYVLMAYERTFVDIANHWSREDVEIMAAKQIVNGYDGRIFAPERTVTRAEFAKMMVQALLNNPYYKMKMTDLARPLFIDVHEKAWYRPFVDTAAYYNIIQGSGNGLFRPENPITREEMAVMIIRVMNSEEEVQWMKDQYDAKLIPAPFNDMNKTSSWAVGSVLLAQQKGIFRGDQNGNLRPRDYVTRGEAAAVLRRTMALQGLLFTPKTIKGILQISTVEGEHLELKTTDESGETFVIIPSDDILKNKLLQYLNKEVILTGFEEDRPSIYIKKMFQALAIGDKIELYCWRCEQKKKEEQQ